MVTRGWEEYRRRKDEERWTNVNNMLIISIRLAQVPICYCTEGWLQIANIHYISQKARKNDLKCFHQKTVTYILGNRHIQPDHTMYI